MNFKRYKLFTVFIIITYSGSSAPFIPPPSEEEPNSKDSSRTSLKPLELGNQCATLPEVGESHFRKLIEKNCYVDKTEYLYKMVNRTQSFWLLSRPRRFGKTLLISTMESFFKGEQELFVDTKMHHMFIKSFGNLRIKCFNVPKYPVIRLDFSNFEAKSFPQFYRGLLALLQIRAKDHNIHLDAQDVSTALRQLIESLHKKYGKMVVILIDEYDSPFTEIYTNNKGEASQVLGTLQSFFKTLKASYKNIRFSFTTGITRLALSDFFSGGNVFVDLTMDPEYAGIVGFNEKELRQYFGGYIENVAKREGNTTKNILNEMRKWHGGFRFTMKNESLYSPISVIGYLRSMGDVNTYSETAGLSKFLVEKLKEFKKEAIEVFINCGIIDQSDESNEKNKITAKKSELTGKINFEDSTDPTALIVVLFHSGYLSINSYDNTTATFSLRFSNLELKQAYAERLYYSFTGQGHSPMEKRINSMVQDLDTSCWESFISKLNSFNSSIPYYLNVNQRSGLEAWLQFTMYLVLHFSTYKNIGKPLMEDATNKGRSDIIVSMNNKMYIFEPKMVGNPENPVYECKVKYSRKHFFGTMDDVVCIGLKFNQDGGVGSWGVAKFSKEGKLIEESGNILLTTQLNLEEKKKIMNIFTEFKQKHSDFSLQPDKIIEFLTQIGPTTDDEQNFAKNFTTDIGTMCTLLGKIKKELQSNLKFIINGFLNRNDPEKKVNKVKYHKKRAPV